jgi:uncharacterized protein involved in cysteine biosynthesis
MLPQALRHGRQGPRPLLDGLLALQKGATLLVSTRGTKRWLVAPAIATFGAFVAATWWLYRQVSQWVEHGREWAIAQLPELGAPWRGLAEQAIDQGLSLAAGKLASAFVALSLGLLVSLWAFSLLYELLAGPFLDEVHGVVERRWFGEDPRAARERPKGITTGQCAALLGVCVLVAASLIVGARFMAWNHATWIAAALSLGFLALLALRKPAFGAWLRWRAAVELRTVLASLKASAVSGVLLLFALPVLFVPLVGKPLFALFAGFTTALSLLDIPMSRRRWSFATRWRFLSRNPLPLVAFGACAGLGFLLPVLGPLLVVPCASVGGLWLLVRIDKTHLRRAP